MDLIQDLTANQRYDMIVEETNLAIELSSEDKALQIDAYFLQACALYRLYRPLEAVTSFNLGKRVRARLQEEKDLNDLSQNLAM